MIQVRVGVVNTGWWADAMYLPALQGHPQAEVTAVCGRNPDKAAAFAALWDVPNFFVDYREMIESGLCDAVVVASPPQSHHEITMMALAHGLHVLCEKPLAVTVAQGVEMSKAATDMGIKTLVPFTYRFLPHARYIKQLIDEGYIGTPYHLNIRYYHGFGRSLGYGWRWDADLVGVGDLANLASHPIYLATWYFGEIESVMAILNQTVPRGKLNPAGEPFVAADDNGVLLLRFKNGALGSIHYSTVSYETSCFKQQHFMDFQGSDGTLYHINDWAEKQETQGARMGSEPMQPLSLPDDIWGHAHITNIHESYKAVFRRDLYMVGEFIDSILGNPIRSRTPLPTFADGLAVQKVIAAAVLSSAEVRRVLISEIEYM